MTKRSFIEILQDRISSNDFQLPVFDKTSLLIQKEIAKEDADIDLIEKYIIRDQALTAQLLKVANSAFYGGLGKVSSVRGAISRLGILELSHMIILITQKDNFKSKDPLVADIMKRLWQHSVGCAIGSHWIAKTCGYYDITNEAFIGGLLHDTGKLVLLSALVDVKRLHQLETEPSEQLIYEVLKDFHEEIGFVLMQKWNLPNQYCEIAQNHHAEHLDPQNYLMAVIRLADKACHKMGIGFKNLENYALSTTAEAELLDLSDLEIAKLEIKLEDSLQLSA